MPERGRRRRVFGGAVERLDSPIFSDPPILPSVGQLIPRTWLLR